MAAEREQRENSDGSSDFERIIDTLCHELLLPGSVHLMLSSVDEVNRRLTTTYHLSPPAAFEYLAVWPPWLPETQASS
jgi:hypothetical protein